MTQQRGPVAEDGSATMWLIPMVAVLGVATLILAHIGAALVQRRQAQSAADLAALAGATALQRDEDGCARAAATAQSNRSELVGCVVAGDRITVRVQQRVELPVLGDVPVTGRARAGPARLPRGRGGAPDP